MNQIMSETVWHTVVPHAGTWIEITENKTALETAKVVPHAGTWIEIENAKISRIKTTSFPTRERGLKLRFAIVSDCPHRRSPRGNVD